MKKFWLIISSLMLVLVLSACGDQGEETTTEKKDEAPTEEEVKKAVVKLYMNLERSINAVDADLNAYEHAEEPEAAQITAASEAATAAADAVKKVEIPSELEAHKADIEAAFNDYTAGYEAKAEELKKAAPSMDAADELFVQGDEKLGKVFEAVGLLKPSLQKSVQ